MKNIFLLFTILGISVLMINCSKKSPIEEMIEKNNKITSDVIIKSDVTEADVAFFIEDCYKNERNRLLSSCENTIGLKDQIYKYEIDSKKYRENHQSEIKELQHKLDSINTILGLIKSGTYPDSKYQQVYLLKNKYKDITIHKAYLCEYSDTSHLSAVNRLIAMDSLGKVVIDIIK